MPDVERLAEKNRKALLGCIGAKTAKWRRQHPSRTLRQATTARFFRECSRSLGLEPRLRLTPGKLGGR